MNERKFCTVCNGDLAPEVAIQGMGDPLHAKFHTRGRPVRAFFDYLKCQNCGALVQSRFISPRFDRDWEDDPFGQSCLAAETHFKLVSPYLSNGARVLDFGSGKGDFRRIAEISDPDKPVVEVVNFDPLSHTDQNWTSEFDVVTLFHVVEHLEKPHETLQDLRKLVKPGGLICLTVHDSEHFLHRLYGRYSPIFDVQHSQIFNAEALRVLCSFGSIIQNRLYKDHYSLRYILASGGVDLPLPDKPRLSLSLGNRFLVMKL